jgi:hypothetical protein
MRAHFVVECLQNANSREKAQSFCDHQRDPGAVTVFAKLQAERITGTADTCVTFELEQYKWPRSGPSRSFTNH